MKITYSGINYNGFNRQIIADEPTECPICKHSLKPTVLNKHIIDNNKGVPSLYINYLCTHCYEPFICKFTDLHKHINYSNNSLFDYCVLHSTEPNGFEKTVFNEYVEKLSPSFVKIYNQSLQAEHSNLDEIAGIGYRKALEFLIKDFLIYHENKDESKVKSTALGTCINTMIENPQLKTVASRATWLGNDQTHYEQKYTDKDINDLKKLIKLSVNWIEIIYLTDEAEDIEKK